MNKRFTAVECRGFRDAASDYLDGHEPTPAQEEIKRHLDLCRSCRTFFDELQLTVDKLSELHLDLGSPRAEEIALHTFREALKIGDIDRNLAAEVKQVKLRGEKRSRVSGEERLELLIGDPRNHSMEFCVALLTRAEEKVSSDPRKALRLAEVCVEIARALRTRTGDWDTLASSLACLSVARANVSDLSGAKEALEQARLALSKNVKSQLTHGRVLAATSWIASQLGYLYQAANACQQAYESFEAAGERQRALCSKIMLGGVLAEAGLNSEAIQALTHALSMVEEESDPPRQLLAAQMNLCLVYCEVGQPEAVVQLLPAMKRLAGEVGGDAPLHHQWLQGTVARVQGEWKSALRIFFEVREHFRCRRECLHYLESSLDALRVYLATDNWTAAARLATDTVRECRGMTREPELLRAVEVLEEDAVARSLTELQIGALRKLVGGRAKVGWMG